MILYFSGTGNNFAVAKKLSAGLGDNIIDIAMLAKNNDFTLKFEQGESLGFVLPVYFGGLPSIVEEFIQNASFVSLPEYIYGVFTYGNRMDGGDIRLKKALKKRGLKLNAVFGMEMPDNYLPLFNPPKEEECQKIIENAYQSLPGIISAIKEKAEREILSKGYDKLYSTIVYPLYDLSRNTKGFYANEDCVGCGLCKKICPQNKIKFSQGKPVWEKGKCVYCMACINRCPKHAIQIGNGTKTKRRFVNPIYSTEK